MRILTILLVVAVTIFNLSCQKEKADQESASTAMEAGHKVMVEEVIQTSSYTYLKVSEMDKSYWIAVGKSKIDKGMMLYYERGLEMKNFESKDLERTFDTILFVDQFSDKPITVSEMQVVADVHSQNRSIAKEEISVTPPADGITIGKLYSDRQSYSDQTVIVSGKVTKFNPGIMGRNWVHIQDGSESDGKFDLTVTTDQSVTVGDVVTFSGEIALDKDFGAGYTYEVIMENAKILN